MPPNETMTREVRLTDETIAFLEEKMAAAVRDGIKNAMTEETAEAFWSAGFRVLQKQATVQTGRLVLDGISGLMRKLFKVLLLAGVLYWLGGWKAVVWLWKTTFSG